MRLTAPVMPHDPDYRAQAVRFTSTAAKQRQSAAKYAYRRTAAEQVKRRWQADDNRCEGCRRQVDIVESHHVFGRGSMLSDRFASTPELMAPLCCSRSWGMTERGCHEIVTQEPAGDLAERLRWAAVQRFARKYGLSPAGHRPLDVVRRMAAEIEAREAEG